MTLPDVELTILTPARIEFPGVSFGTQIPADLVDRLPFVRIRVVPAAGFHPTLARRAAVDVDVWDDDRKDAADLATALQAWFERGPEFSHGKATTEPWEFPETDNSTMAQALYRFQATYRLVVRAS